MTALRTVLAIALLGALGFAAAEERGSTPPGTSRDGGRPADGAIKGGAILPGESGGIPDGRSAAGGSSAPPPEQAVNRCRELEGMLREQCLRDVREAARRPAVTAPGESR